MGRRFLVGVCVCVCVCMCVCVCVCVCVCDEFVHILVREETATIMFFIPLYICTWRVTAQVEHKSVFIKKKFNYMFRLFM
jgi:hypothetical protein